MKITVISSFATDMIKGKPRRGGPALFITNCLAALGAEYEIFSAEGVVEIDENERGKVLNVGKIQGPYQGGTVLISTLLDEYEPRTIGKFNCIDVQGYVRAGRNICVSGFDIVKGTEEEIRKTDLRYYTGTVIITKGEKGFEIITKEKKYIFPCTRIRCCDTIGAGDTLFAAFCTKYRETRDVRKSGEFARDTVSRFLRTKEVKE